MKKLVNYIGAEKGSPKGSMFGCIATGLLAALGICMIIYINIIGHSSKDLIRNVLITVLFSITSVSFFLDMHSRSAEINKKARELESQDGSKELLDDFDSAEKLVGDIIRVGKKHCFGKKCKTIAEISDIAELKVEKPLDVFLIARMRGGNDVTLCRESSKKIKEPTYYDHMAPVINALCERNPSIVINRESAHKYRKAEEAAPDKEENQGCE